MNWFCSCQPKTRDAIQVYSIIDHNNANKAYPKTPEEVSAGRATAAETLENIKKETQRLKPRKEIQLPSSKEGYISIQELKGKNQQTNIFRKIQKSDYGEIVEKCIKKNEKWTDPDFAYTIDPEKNTRVNKTYKIAKWKRISQLFPEATFMGTPVRPTQIMQGNMNNCYWMSAVAAIAEREYRVKNLFCSHQASKHGVYLCKLLYNGIYKEIIVDDFVPIGPNDEPLCARLYNDTDFWVLILEKCWAKINGSYDAINMGFNNESLWTLTSSPILGEFDTSYFRLDSGISNKFFEKLKFHSENIHLITCSVSNIQEYNQYALKTNHSYSVLGVFQTQDQGNKVRLLQIRNPLGSSGFRQVDFPSLPYNLKDSFWSRINPKEKDRLQYWRIQSEHGAGIFYVSWQNFLMLFNQVTISQVDDNANYIYDSITLGKSPKYLSLVVSANAQFHLIIAQKRLARFTPAKYARIRVLVASVTHTYDNQTAYSYVLSQSFQSSKERNYMSVDLSELTAGNYLIRIDTKFQQKDTDLTLGYFAPGDFSIKFLQGINDDIFVSKTLLSRAKSINPKSNPNKVQLQGGAKGWRCIENIQESNFCYIAYHMDTTSKAEKYSVQFDQSKNIFGQEGKQHHLQFEGPWTGKTSLKQVIGRGQELLIPYTYTYWMPQPAYYPGLLDGRPLPTPIFTPL